MRTFVVETDEDIYLGHIDIVDGLIRVRSGLRGQPALVDPNDIVRMLPAEEHPDVLEDEAAPLCGTVEPRREPDLEFARPR